MGMQRLAHVDVTVTDLDLATAYYTEVIGMLETERDENSVYLKCWDEPNHHSLRLIYGPRVGFDLMSFKVDRDDDLEEFERRVLNYGFPVRRVQPLTPPSGRKIILNWFSPRSQAISLFSCSGCKVCRKTWMVFFNIVSGSKRVSASSLAPSES